MQRYLIGFICFSKIWSDKADREKEVHTLRKAIAQTGVFCYIIFFINTSICSFTSLSLILIWKADREKEMNLSWNNGNEIKTVLLYNIPILCNNDN